MAADRRGPQGRSLFDGGLEDRLAAQAPLAARLRPRTLDEVVGQGHLVGPGGPLRALIEADRLSSAILWGPPGTGKTTLARLAASHTGKQFVALSAVAAGVRELRQVLEDARGRLAGSGQGTILFLDEVHRFNRAQQESLLPWVEEGLVVLVGATTENPFFALSPPLLSRSGLFRLEPLAAQDLEELLARGLELEGASAEPEAVAHLVELAQGDARVALIALETALSLAGGRAGGAISLADARRARGARALRHGADDHYDLASALIKSVRGSDPDAGLYWMARMLEAGEDPRFVARRLLILASEDVGLADPRALVVAEAAARALEVVGLPEAALNLAEAVVYLACAPKSNRVAVALGRASEDARRHPNAPVPEHLRGSPRPGPAPAYLYPHDFPGGWVEQAYLPDELTGRRYYQPGETGEEAELARRLVKHRAGGPPP
jgi:putative ATPase